MVVYNSLCADLSKEFLDFIPGSIEEKLLTLQEQLGEHFPEIVLQYLCGEEQNIVQIKGSWRDVQNIHEVLEAWMNSGQKEEQEDSNFAEKIEGITDGVFIDQDKQPPLDIAESAIKEDFDASSDQSILNNPTAKEQIKSNEDVNEEQPTSSVADIENDRTVTSENPITSTPLEKIGTIVTRSGRKVKRTFVDSDEDDYHFDSSEGLQVISKIDHYDSKGFDLLVGEKQDSNDVSLSSGGIGEDGTNELNYIEETNSAVMKNDKRGRKKKKLKTIDFLEVESCLNESIEKSSDGECIKCRLCNFTTNARRHLKAHILRCHTEAGNTCKLCKKKYALEKDLRAHMKTHYPQYRCKLCARRFPTRSLLDLHLQRYHNEAKEIKRQQKLHGPSVFKCDKCEYTSELEKNLKDHIARHHSEKNFACDLCHKAFGLKKDLVTHSKVHTDKFTCEICGKSLASKHALKMHINVIHKGIKNTYSKTYVCDHCGELCRNKTHYSEHMNRQHLHVKPYGCPLCTMSFYTNASLKAHLTTHTDERKFKCETCGKGFKAANSMRVHMLTHLEQGQRPHVCSTCGKSFAQKGALVRHMRIHSGEKPYKCRLCESAFTDYSILRRHMLGVHKINSRELCKLSDSVGNRGGPKPERIKVDNISKFRNMIREPTENDTDSKQLSDADFAILKAHSTRVEDLKLEQNIQLQLSSDNKLAFAHMETSTIDPTAPVRYIIQDGGAVRTEAVQNGLLVGDINPNDITVNRSGDFSMPSVMQPVTEEENEVVNGLAYSDMPFTVQRYITGEDSQNISIQILHPQESV